MLLSRKFAEQVEEKRNVFDYLCRAHYIQFDNKTIIFMVFKTFEHVQNSMFQDNLSAITRTSTSWPNRTIRLVLFVYKFCNISYLTLLTLQHFSIMIDKFWWDTPNNFCSQSDYSRLAFKKICLSGQKVAKLQPKRKTKLVSNPFEFDAIFCQLLFDVYSEFSAFQLRHDVDY